MTSFEETGDETAETGGKFHIRKADFVDPDYPWQYWHDLIWRDYGTCATFADAVAAVSQAIRTGE